MNADDFERITPVEEQGATPFPDSKGNDTSESRTLLNRVFFSPRIGMIALLFLLGGLLYLLLGKEMRFFMVPSASMEPTLFAGDMIVTFNQKAYARGDIVVMKHEGEYLVKRIIGLPGDSLTIIDGALFINGKYASEPYVRESMHYYIEEPVLIPPGYFFYLGDNRNLSDDSSRGFANYAEKLDAAARLSYLGVLNDIIGKVHFIYYPYNRLGNLPSYILTNTAGS
ncbi:MAG TPA: signal peptidase I [Candidatus Hydrogenedentes bacterium]|nr:signal peptidase I [Candidatus Hydrogenedentota bacterium]HOH43477.1 signal peptidase I [Candidatus Hydrogenedentota bacterium]HOR49917.1 signal peptidase I [Candidatus Hydrogenedentota bacterium]HPK23910.1 signal peptidase I [Candidatus Hydrogenedentota bacterium]